jgi:hypothetical protein
MAKNYWLLSRPKRKLILVPDLLKIFSTVAAGQKWERNRGIQAEFERQLVDFQWKAQNTSTDGSGARTYAILLFMLGLWFEDENGVQITNAGIEMLNDDPPVPILTKQLLDFQYPSPYSLKLKVDVNREIRIRPHRFIVRLLLEKKLEEITQDEIAFCLVALAKSDNDIEKCYEFLLEYRKNPGAIISTAISISGTTEDNLRNIGNTFINQLEYTGWFMNGDDLKSLKIKPEKIENVKKALEDSKQGLIQNPEDQVTFQMRYGSGLTVSKDYRYTPPKRTAIDPNERAIMLSFYEATLNNPIDAIDDELITQISERRGVPKELVLKVVKKIAGKPLMDIFEERYLKLSTGGTETAKDFEIKTNNVLSGEGFGFASVWVGPKPRHPDLFVYFDKVNKKHGILDTKAYSEYNLPLDHKNKMAHTYIPSFKKLIFEGDEYDLSFFSYVAGGYGTNMHNSFRELTTMTDVRGSYITAFNFLKLLRQHRVKPFSAKEFGLIFGLNKEILDEEIVRN